MYSKHQMNNQQFSFENFHLDPHDFQNFLLINPPLTEYSNRYMAQRGDQPDDSLLHLDVQATTNNTQPQPFYSVPLQPSNDSNEGILPSRRLSISNGQIGQISMMVHQNYEIENDYDNSTTSSNDVVPKTAANITKRPTSNPGSAPASGMMDFMPQTQTQNTQTQKPNTANPPMGFETDHNGVPTRELIYNNEVIFNPNEPIPGTNAWKRNKILERNRIAASKCRAKKKNLQKQLQDRVDTLNFENNKLKEMLVDIRDRLIKYTSESNIDLTNLLPQEVEPEDNEIDDVDHIDNLSSGLQNQIDEDRKHNDRVEKLLERRRVFEKKRVINKRVDAFIKSGVL